MIEKLDNNKYLEINSIIVENCLAKANKNILNQLKEKWNLLNDYALDSQYGAVACYIIDGVIRVVSENEIIITFDYESMTNRGYKIISKIENLFEKVFENKYRIALITTEEWNTKKQEYIENRNKGIVYEYKDVPDWNLLEIENKNIKIGDSSSITEEAIQLFGENIVTNI